MSEKKKAYLIYIVIVIAVTVFFIGLVYLTGSNKKDDNIPTFNEEASSTQETEIVTPSEVTTDVTTEATSQTSRETSGVYTETYETTEESEQITTQSSTTTTQITTSQTTTEITTHTETTPPEVDEITDFRVIAYLPYWTGAGANSLRYDIITHIMYAFAIPTADGSLLPLENEKLAQSVIEKAHNNDTKVLLSVGGWSYNSEKLEPVFTAATSTDEKLYKLGDAIVEMCEKYGFDGVDMDWEHPRIADGTYKRYEKLMLYLDEKLTEKGKLLTAAVMGGVTIGGYTLTDAAAHTDKVLEAVDWINIMAYDGGEGEEHSPYYFAENCLNYWLKRTSGDKITLGTAFYSSPGGISYKKLVSSVDDAHLKDSVIYNNQTVYYCGMQTTRNKTALALKKCSGIMIWEITHDTDTIDKSLLTAIGQEIAANR